MEWLTELLAPLLAALFALGGYLLGRYSKGAAEDKIRTVTEVVTVRDTVTIEKPVYIERKVTETMLVEVRDTVLRHDTLYIKLPREEVVYEGEDYRAQVSGYQPCLDWVQVYPETITKTISVTSRKRWGISVNAGYGVTKDGLSPYIGVGVSWDLWQF